MFSGAKGAVRLSGIVVVCLVVLKVATSAVTGSLSIMAQAADSFLDLFAVGVTFLAIRIAAKPADAEHPFGHGKAENMAAIIQAVLILLAGGTIIYSSIVRIQTGAALAMTEAGMGVMAVSIAASIFLSRHLMKVARREDSMALEANARNIAADVYSAAAVLVGLLVVRLTGLSIIDPILAVLVALFILKVGYDVLRNSFGGLVDVKLPGEEEEIIQEAIREHFWKTEHEGYVLDFHKLRTRKAGNQRYIDLHLIMPRKTSLEDAHRMCDHLEEVIESRLPRTDVTIHVEPCDDNCTECDAECEDRQG